MSLESDLQCVNLINLEKWGVAKLYGTLTSITLAEVRKGTKILFGLQSGCEFEEDDAICYVDKFNINSYPCGGVPVCDDNTTQDCEVTVTDDLPPVKCLEDSDFMTIVIKG